ncbi:hypothetical protein CEXT_584321 [Caerostris extrusa]|uniref:Uncharacterized protein n=1 Tax=Caerostris extrusa TaxID=172846 RepID=A0AAV4NJ83_CAEEX|nr:hypothetical protein CEXT_584321 [Caerostris extrusa]
MDEHGSCWLGCRRFCSGETKRPRRRSLARCAVERCLCAGFEKVEISISLLNGSGLGAIVNSYNAKSQGEGLPKLILIGCCYFKFIDWFNSLKKSGHLLSTDSKTPVVPDEGCRGQSVRVPHGIG